MADETEFRWEVWVIVPLTILVMLWLIGGVKTGITWPAIVAALGVENTTRYAMLAVLGLLGIGIVSVLRILRQGSDD